MDFTASLNETSISSQISGLLHGDLPLTFTLHYLDTPENRKPIITEIANLYGYFLTQEAHEKEYCSRLREKGMWIEIKDASGYFPTNEDIDLFIQSLTQCMTTDLSTIPEYLNESSTKLGMDYGPDRGTLRNAFQKADLNNNCYSLLPYKTMTLITIREKQITVAVDLKGPLF